LQYCGFDNSYLSLIGGLLLLDPLLEILLFEPPATAHFESGQLSLRGQTVGSFLCKL